MATATGHSGEKAPAFFAPLEGMRGLAAVGVVLYHSYYHWHINAVGIVMHGNLFVDLFFVISGFVIAHIYGTRLRDGRELAKFALLRTARLYPLHLFTLLLVAGYTVATKWAAHAWKLPIGPGHNSDLGHNTLRMFLDNLLLVQAIVEHRASFNRPSWSISTEYYTYFIFALVALATAYYKKLRVPACMLLAGCALGYLLWRGSLTLDTRLLRCIGGFFVGTLVYAAWHAWHPRVEHMLGHGWKVHAAELAAVAMALAAVWHAGKGLNQFLVIPAFALLVFLLAAGRGVAAAFIRHRYVQNLGKWSYSIYMVHFTLILLISDAARLTWRPGIRVFLWWPVWKTSLLTLLLVVAVLAVASLTFRFIEDPPRRWAKRWAARRWGRDRSADRDALVGAP